LGSIKATYKFCDNETVEPKKILSAHQQAQQSQLSGRDDLLVVSDTTFLTSRVIHPTVLVTSVRPIGVESVKLHTSIRILLDTHRMTGVIDQQVLVEDQ